MIYILTELLDGGGFIYINYVLFLRFLLGESDIF